MEITKVFSALILGYLLGSLNSSLIIGKMYGVDVRKHGSGNAGMTNTLRTLGKLPAILVTVGDIAKAIIACILGGFIVGTAFGFGHVGFLLAGVGAVLGHNWPVFFGFKGGKGVLTTFAVILMMNWQVGLILFGVFVVLVIIFRYISLGSIVGASLFPIISYFGMAKFNLDLFFVVCAMLLGVLIVARHHSNIVRLVSGTENKFSLKKKA